MLDFLIHFLRYHRVTGSKGVVEKAIPTSEVYHTGVFVEGRGFIRLALHMGSWNAFCAFVKIEQSTTPGTAKEFSTKMRAEPNVPIANLDLIRAVVLGDPAVTDMLLDVAGKGS